MKALYTNETLESLKVIREMCGGHGFLQVSGLPIIIGNSLIYIYFNNL